MRNGRNSRRNDPTVAVVGTGYVGLVTGACLAEMGTRVTCVDADATKIDMLQQGKVPFFEPGLAELVTRNAVSRKLSFSVDTARAVREADVVFIAVGTPPQANSHADLSAVWDVARAIGSALDGPKIVVLKSTAPIGTCDGIASILAANAEERYHVDVVSNPEFLREGSALSAFMTPDRVVIGCNCDHAESVMRGLYQSLNVPFLITDARTSEAIKYASNAFLAARISAINEIANICDAFGVDATIVRDGMALDHRIGMHFLHPGLGFGGSCFPKDVRALERMALERGYEARLLQAVDEVNRGQVPRAISRIESALGGSLAGKTICVFGLAFKANTSDVRESPAVRLIEGIAAAGASVRAHDPVAIDEVSGAVSGDVTLCPDVYEAVAGADAAVIATDWPEYLGLDFAAVASSMRGDLVFDGRNLLDPSTVVVHGLRYLGVGRSAVPSKPKAVPA